VKPVSPLLKRRHIDPAGIVADTDRLRTIVEDLRTEGGEFTPTSNWVTLDTSVPHNRDGREWIEESFSETSVNARMGTMDKMVNAWLGLHQIDSAKGEPSRRYRPWLAEHDPLGLWKANFEDEAVAATLRIADLGTAMDLNLLWSFMRRTDERTTILEVGGGYGRLAEAALNVFGGLKYVMVDGVPGSLLYANEYMRKACPDARIGFYYDGDAFDLDAFDCYIVPSWHFERVNTAVYDACVNIDSFQEMKLDHVHYFLNLFDRVSRPGTVFYSSNFHDLRLTNPNEVLAGSLQWEYPASWRHLLSANTPRSSYPNNPADILVKEEGDWALMNAQIRAAHEWASAQRREKIRTIPQEAGDLARRVGAAVARRLPGRRK
jgi:hypothetical protein